MSKDKKAKRSFFPVRVIKRIGRFFKETKSELKKVVWLSPRQTVKNSIVVLLFIVFFAVLIGVLDFVLRSVVDLILRV